MSFGCFPKLEINICPDSKCNWTVPLKNIICSSCCCSSDGQISHKDGNVEFHKDGNVEFPCTIQLSTPTDVIVPSDVTSIVRLASGNFLVCDWENKALKMLDGNYVVVSEVILTGKPHTVCVFNENEVAVSLRDKKEIVFVSVNNALQISSRPPIKTEDKCRGMVCVNGELYVGSGGCTEEGPGKVEAYAISGRRIIGTDAEGKRLFGVPYALAVNSNGSEVHITDFGDGVVIINPRGAVLKHHRHPSLQWTSGICMDDKGNFFVAGEKSNNVMMIRKNGSTKEVLNASDGLVNPTSVCYDPKKKSLLVGMVSEKPLAAFQIHEYYFTC